MKAVPQQTFDIVSSPQQFTGRGEWVLVTEGGDGRSRSSVAAVRSLTQAGYKAVVTVSASTGLSLARASRFCRYHIEVPDADQSPDAYAAAVRAEFARRDYVAVLPTSDEAIAALRLRSVGLMDKVACYPRALAAGLPMPEAQPYSSAAAVLEDAERLPYPVIVKPSLKRTTAVLVRDRTMLRDKMADLLAHDGPVLVQRFIQAGLHGVVGVMWKGRLLQSVHMRYLRIFPEPCGTVTAALTTAPDARVNAALERLLEGFEGPFHVDMAGGYLLDLNPRLHATLQLCIAAGVNPAVSWCDLLNGEDVPERHGVPNVFFRWIEGELKGAWQSWRGRRSSFVSALRRLKPHPGAIHGYERFDDPGPVLERLRFATRRITHGESSFNRSQG